VALIDSLGVDQVFLVAHDWGALVGWYTCLFRPDRIKAYVCLSVPFMPRNPKVKPVDAMRALYGDDYYVCRFQVLPLPSSFIAPNIASYVSYSYSYLWLFLYSKVQKLDGVT